MLVHQRKPFIKGMFLLISFAIVCGLLLFPLLPDESKPGHHLTGLEFADSVFNSLSKGSSYFVPEVRKSVETVKDKQVTISVPLKKPELGETIVKVYEALGAEAVTEGGRVRISGNLHTILNAATEVGDKLYFNDTKPIEDLYNQPALMVSRAFWYTLNPGIKDMQRQGLLEEAKVTDQVIRKALEPGNNFFSVPVAKVSDHIHLIVGMLVFYIVYTLWYGFGIMEMFEGIGLSIHK